MSESAAESASPASGLPTSEVPGLALPHAVALAWGIAASPRRGPRRELSVAQIVQVAVRLADEEGLGAVSMARVAGELGYTTMSLYRYVTSKDDLLQLMQDEVSEFEIPGAPLDSTDAADVGTRNRDAEDENGTGAIQPGATTEDQREQQRAAQRTREQQRDELHNRREHDRDEFRAQREHQRLLREEQRSQRDRQRNQAQHTSASSEHSGTGWRTALRTWAEATAAQLARHPWFVELPITGIPMMPKQLALLEKGLEALADTPLSGQEKMASILALMNQVRGMATIANQLRASGVSPGQATGGAYREGLQKLLDPKVYPEVTRLLVAGELTDEHFDDAKYAIERILDGIAARIEECESQSPEAPEN